MQLPDQSQQGSGPRALRGKEANPKPQQFTIGTIFLVTTLIAVCLGLFRVSPVLGVASLLFVVPAFLRTLSLAEREREYGGRLTVVEKVVIFVGSLAVTLWSILVAGVTLIVGCFVAVASGQLLFVWNEPLGAFVGFGGSFVAVVLAVAAGGWAVRQSWPPREVFVAQLHRGNYAPSPDKRQNSGMRHNE